MKIHPVQKWNRLRFTHPEIYMPKDSTSWRRRIFDGPWGRGVQVAHWRTAALKRIITPFIQHACTTPNKLWSLHSVHWKLMEWLWLETNQKILRFMSCDWQKRRESVTPNKHEAFFMNEINDSVFREGIGWWVPVFQDGDYTHKMDSANLSTCQMVVPFGNYHHRFKTNFCCYLFIAKYLATKRRQISFLHYFRSG